MIAERLERLVDEMVEKGVQFDDAVQRVREALHLRACWDPATAA